MDEEIEAFARDVKDGLTRPNKRLHCRYFYDDAGSHLFEEICKLEEYYLPRAEREILESRAGELARLAPERAILVELGSGNAAKTRIVIRGLLEKSPRLVFIPVDVSQTMLVETARALRAEHSGLEVLPIAADYETGLLELASRRRDPKLILWLGSNIGNFDRQEAPSFLGRVKGIMSAGDLFLVGLDLRKDKRTLEAAYDDGQKVTAEFNKNILRRINRELGGDFDVGAFSHRAVYQEQEGRIEMYLVSAKTQKVTIRRLGLEVAFEAGEAVHTENSYKYDGGEIAALADAAGLRIAALWKDRAERFADVVFGL